MSKLSSFISFVLFNIVAATTNTDVTLLTPRSSPTDARTRLLRAAELYKYPVREVGGAASPPAEQLAALKKEVKEIAKDAPDSILLWLDGTDALITAGPLRVVEELTRDREGPGGAVRVLVAADGVLWPVGASKDAFPKPALGRRFLDAGGIVGTAGALDALLQDAPADAPSLQEALIALYTDPASRARHAIAIDHASNMFQNLHGATGDLEVRFAGREGYLQNTAYSSVPLVIRANRETAVSLNSFANYLAKGFNPDDGCRECWENMLSLEEVDPKEYPLVTLAVVINRPVPFLEEFLWKLKNQTYPKDRIDLYFHNMVPYHEQEVSDWLDSQGRQYRSLKYTSPEDPAKEWHSKGKAVEHCQSKNCAYLMLTDGHSHLDNPFVIKLLVEQNRGVLAPMLARPHKPWSNFWGGLTEDGFYSRSFDYLDIVKNIKRGLWNVPYVAHCYMVRRDVIDSQLTKPDFVNKLMDADMAFSANMRKKGVHLHVTNRLDMGHLVSSESFNTKHFKPEMWEMFENRWDWEARYLHPNYSQSLDENTTIAMPCPDVYWFPVFSTRFSQEMIDVNENYGKWSDGSHMDKRLEGGYETVPTVDIHTNQIEYRDEWLDILRAYIQPLQMRVFEGYNNDVGPPQALMAFNVRYKPDEQPLLRPHHDTSTYTINVALNRPGIDFQGGGVRFVRYNCSVLDTKVGWVLMHPGKLTHLHEGLRTTGGTRYIMVTFIDP